MIARLKRLKWYWWLALIAPGGLLVLIWRSRQTPKAPAGVDVGVNASSVRTSNLVESAVVQAETLRNALKNDPLAASLLGVSPSLIMSSDPATTAANSAKRDDINAQIASAQNEIAQQAAGWSKDHAGGQSPAQYQAIIDGINARIAALQAQAATL